MSMNPTIIRRVREQFPSSVEEETEFRGDLCLRIRREDLLEVCRFLKSDAELAFDMLIDLCGVDMYRPENRFEVVSILYSLKNRTYLRVKVSADTERPVIDSLGSVWEGAAWHEREAYDMYGITFTGHPDLRRMYLPEEFEHYPLRKDFPLMGIPDSLPLPRK